MSYQLLSSWMTLNALARLSRTSVGRADAGIPCLQQKVEHVQQTVMNVDIVGHIGVARPLNWP